MCAGDGWPVLVRRRDQHVPGSSDDVADGSTYVEDHAPTAIRLRLTPFNSAA